MPASRSIVLALLVAAGGCADPEPFSGTHRMARTVTFEDNCPPTLAADTAEPYLLELQHVESGVHVRSDKGEGTCGPPEGDPPRLEVILDAGLWASVELELVERDGAISGLEEWVFSWTPDDDTCAVEFSLVEVAR